MADPEELEELGDERLIKGDRITARVRGDKRLAIRLFWLRHWVVRFQEGHPNGSAMAPAEVLDTGLAVLKAADELVQELRRPLPPRRRGGRGA